jgi:hypothetical protein
MGTCVSTQMPPDGEAAQRLVAERVKATGRRALMYFHAEISTGECDRLTGLSHQYHLPGHVNTNSCGIPSFLRLD